MPSAAREHHPRPAHRPICRSARRRTGFGLCRAAAGPFEPLGRRVCPRSGSAWSFAGDHGGARGRSILGLEEPAGSDTAHLRVS